MKKVYIKPHIDVIELKSTEIIATSLTVYEEVVGQDASGSVNDVQW